MKLSRLLLRNFRCYHETEVVFGDKVNVLHGKNSSGKTTLLEALYLLSTGRSFLTPHLIHLVQNDQPHFYIESHFIKENVLQTLRLGFDGKTKKISHNTTFLKSFSHLLGILPCVLYSPKDGALISSGPQERRRFLNIQLGQTDPLYVYHLVRYYRAMEQRNVLLKKQSDSGIAAWEAIMGESGRFLVSKRLRLIEHLRPSLQAFSLELSDNEDLFDLHYVPAISAENMLDFEARLAKHRPKEFAFGRSLIGPHRDDFQITYQKKEAKMFASEGQKRTCIAALKMSEWTFLKQETSLNPLFAIDDFGIHLDPERTQALYKKLSSFGQVIVTTPSFFKGESSQDLSEEKRELFLSF